jgi:hypothetical protein
MSVKRDRGMSPVAGVARAAMAALALGLAATSAHALPAPVSYEYFGIAFYENVQSSNTFGTLDYTDHPGCGGICTATTTLGSDPSETIEVYQVPYMDSGGGYSEATLGYYLEVMGSGTTTIYLHAGDSLVAPPSGSAQAYIAVGPAAMAYSSDNNFMSYAYQDTDCAGYCSDGVANAYSPLPLPADQPISIDEGVTYFVEELLVVSAATSETQLSEMADPTFTAGPGVTILYSPGVTGGVPEPAAWSMILVGFGGLGAAQRMSRRRRTLAGA